MGALGQDPDGKNTIFNTASKAHITSSGILSASGNIGACWTSSESEVHVVGTYHIDGMTHGSSPGPAGAFIEQFEFRFVNAN